MGGRLGCGLPDVALVICEEGGDHSEAAWAERFHDAVAWLLAGK